MKCEFCSCEIEDNSYSCPECGSLVRHSIAEKSHTVISLSQQTDISKHKLKSDYKAYSPDKKEDDFSAYYDVSRQAFAKQKFNSENISTANFSDKDFIVKVTSESTNRYDNGKKYTLKPDNKKQNSSSEEASSHKVILKKSSKNKVQLKKAEKKKVQLSKNTESISNNDQKTVSSPDMFHTSRSFFSVDFEREHIHDGYVELPDGISKMDFMKLPYLSSVRAPLFLSLISLYICMIMLTFYSTMSLSAYNLINVLLVMALTFGIQFKTSSICAYGCVLHGILYSLVGNLYFGNSIGIPIFIAGIFASLSIRKFDSLWEEYESTGKIPYEQKI